MDDCTPEDLKAHLYSLLDKRGALKDVRAHLRFKLVEALRSVSDPTVAQEPKGTGGCNLPLHVSNWLICDYLAKHGFEYTLSTFASESGLGSIHLTERDVMHLLNASTQNKIVSVLKHKDSSLLYEVVQHSVISANVSSASTQTDCVVQHNGLKNTLEGSVKSKLSKSKLYAERSCQVSLNLNDTQTRELSELKAEIKSLQNLLDKLGSQFKDNEERYQKEISLSKSLEKTAFEEELSKIKEASQMEITRIEKRLNDYNLHNETFKKLTQIFTQRNEDLLKEMNRLKTTTHLLAKDLRRHMKSSDTRTSSPIIDSDQQKIERIHFYKEAKKCPKEFRVRERLSSPLPPLETLKLSNVPGSTSATTMKDPSQFLSKARTRIERLQTEADYLEKKYREIVEKDIFALWSDMSSSSGSRQVISSRSLSDDS